MLVLSEQANHLSVLSSISVRNLSATLHVGIAQHHFFFFFLANEWDFADGCRRHFNIVERVKEKKMQREVTAACVCAALGRRASDAVQSLAKQRQLHDFFLCIMNSIPLFFSKGEKKF